MNGITADTIEINGTNYNYEIGDIYIIPEEFNIENYLEINSARIAWGIFSGAGIFPGHCLVEFKQQEEHYQIK